MERGKEIEGISGKAVDTSKKTEQGKSHKKSRRYMWTKFLGLCFGGMKTLAIS